jgi:hypothetical protein
MPIDPSLPHFDNAFDQAPGPNIPLLVYLQGIREFGLIAAPWILQSSK